MTRACGVLGLPLTLSLAVLSAAPPEKGRELTAEEKGEVARLLQELNRKVRAGDFEDAVKTAKQIADYRAERQGDGHWEVIGARWDVKTWQRSDQDCAAVLRALKTTFEGQRLLQQRRYRDAEAKHREAFDIFQKVLGEDHPLTAKSCNDMVACLDAQGKHAEALPLHEKTLAIFRKTLGEQNPDTATGYNNLAACLSAHARYAEALPLYQKALAISQKVLGEQHPDTIQSYNNVAGCLQEQGKHADALPLFQKALALRQKILGEHHPDTAQGYNNIAYCLNAQGRHVEALPLFQHALTLRRRLLGEQHPNTATTLDNLATCLNDQGKHAEALPLFQQALGLRQRALGEEHPSTTTSRNNLALCLHAQGQQAEALALFQQALAMYQKVRGEDHPATATVYHNVAACLDAQGKHAEALPLHQKALAINRKVLGEEHPTTATSYNNLALCLNDRGQYADALPLFQKSLVVRQRMLGKQHPSTAASHLNLAICFYSQGKYADASRHFEAALLGHDFGRVNASASGFERTLFRARFHSPRVALAVCMVRLDRPVDAWEQAESDLARGLLDDLQPAADGPVDAARLARLSQLDQALLPLLIREKPTAEETKQRDALVRERADLVADLARMAAQRSGGRRLPLPDIQKHIPNDAAIVFWLDCGDQHLGCVLRREGAPVWVKLPGSGKDQAWNAADLTLPGRALAALSSHSSTPDSHRTLLDQFRRQRIAPLEPHLKGVRHLLVVPSNVMSALPVEALTDRYLVSYIPSARVFARWMEQHRPLRASSLLLLADPIFTRPAPRSSDAPPQGLLIKAVTPGGLAARTALVPGDVLLEYDGKKLTTPDDLRPAAGDDRVAIKVWRDGKVLQGRIPAGNLGVVVDRRPIAEALADWRRHESSLMTLGRGKPWQALPGTRLEARTLASLLPGVETLLGSDASEEKMDQLVASGRLKEYRLLHLATHGEANASRPELTGLVLAQDRLPTPAEEVQLVLAGKKPPEGKLTVDRMLRKDWQLDADLVVLSACESGLGKRTSGEGMLGFTHALLQKGARSVVLARWKVDDAATALLMERFYRNLLGKRDGLKEAMKRAEALAEAKSWLRNLSRGEAEKRLAALVDGVPRGERGSIKAALPTRKPDDPKDDDRPFAHPYSWAAFVLIGDPF